MADNDKDQEDAKPMEPPKAVHIGGESLVDRIVPHIKKILVFFVLVSVVISIFLVIRWRKHAKQEKETARLTEVLALSRRPIGPAAPAIPGMPPPEGGPRFADVKERATAVLDAMAKQGVSGSPAFKGGMLLDAGRIDEAIAEYRKGQPAGGIAGVLAREGLGIALEAKATAAQDAAASQALLEEALAVFGTMQPDETGPRRAYMLYHQGRLQQKLGKLTEAKASFEKAKELGASTELPDLIEQRLAAL